MSDVPHRLKADLVRRLLPTIGEQQVGLKGTCGWTVKRAKVANICATQLVEAMTAREAAANPPGQMMVASATYHRGTKQRGIGFNQLLKEDSKQGHQAAGQQALGQTTQEGKGRRRGKRGVQQGERSSASQAAEEQLPRPKSFEPADPPTLPSYWTAEPQATGRSTHQTLVAMQALARSPEASMEALETMKCFTKCASAHGSTLRYATEVKLVVNGEGITSNKIMMDDGANVDLMDDTFRRRHGIRMFNLPTRLSTSLSTSTETLGITEIVGIQYGTGSQAIKVARPFLVAQGMNELYEVLIGNQDTQAFQATICAFTNTYTMRRPGVKDLVLATVSRPT